MWREEQCEQFDMRRLRNGNIEAAKWFPRPANAGLRGMLAGCWLAFAFSVLSMLAETERAARGGGLGGND